MDPVSSKLLILNQLGAWSNDLLGWTRALVFALLVFVAGLFLAEVAKRLAVALLQAIRWDEHCERWGWSARLRRLRADAEPSSALGGVLFWVVLATGTMKALERLNSPWLLGLTRGYFELLPLAVQAAALLVLTAWLAWATGWLVLAATEHPAAVLTAGLVRTLVLSLGALRALETLRVERAVGLPLVLVLAGAAALAVALGWALNRTALFRTVVRAADDESEEGAGR